MPRLPCVRREPEPGRGVKEGEDVVGDVELEGRGFNAQYRRQAGARTDFVVVGLHRLQVHGVLRAALPEELALRRRAERRAVGREQVESVHHVHRQAELGTQPVEGDSGAAGTSMGAGVELAQVVAVIVAHEIRAQTRAQVDAIDRRDVSLGVWRCLPEGHVVVVLHSPRV